MTKYIISLTERVSATFLFTFLGIISVSSLTDIKALEAAAVAGGLSVAKYLYTVTGAYLASTSAAPSPPVGTQ